MLLAVLASVEFHTLSALPPRITHSFTIIPTAADGLCFWSCLWLACAASLRDVYSWFIRPRTKSGFAQGNDGAWEKKIVQSWALSLPSLPKATEERIRRAHSAEHDDIVS